MQAVKQPALSGGTGRKARRERARAWRRHEAVKRGEREDVDCRLGRTGPERGSQVECNLLSDGLLDGGQSE